MNKYYKTEWCNNILENGHCDYGYKCRFAHNVEELVERKHHPKYKTKICEKFLKGSCTYGKRCVFLHL